MERRRKMRQEEKISNASKKRSRREETMHALYPKKLFTCRTATTLIRAYCSHISPPVSLVPAHDPHPTSLSYPDR